MIKLALYWKMAFVRAAIYFLIVGGSTAQSLSETWSDATWHDMGPFLRARFYISIGLAAFGTLLAFLDTTMATLRAKQEVPPIEPSAPAAQSEPGKDK